jgi:hypothetical protein
LPPWLAVGQLLARQLSLQKLSCSSPSIVPCRALKDGCCMSSFLLRMLRYGVAPPILYSFPGGLATCLHQWSIWRPSVAPKSTASLTGLGYRLGHFLWIGNTFSSSVKTKRDRRKPSGIEGQYQKAQPFYVRRSEKPTIAQ